MSVWRLLIHDWTKFLPCEWFPYVEFFYGSESKKDPNLTGPQAYQTPDDVKDAFDRAWLHHQHANAHHFQHYILHQDSGKVICLPIPDKYIREMVADWYGAGKAITGRWDALKWYEQNKANILLEDGSRDRLEAYLRIVGFRLGVYAPDNTLRISKSTSEKFVV